VLAIYQGIAVIHGGSLTAEDVKTGLRLRLCVTVE